MSIETQSMTNLQLEMLKLFSRKVSDIDLIEIKKMISGYFADKAMNEADKEWSEKGFTNIDADKLANLHLRTSYNTL